MLVGMILRGLLSYIFVYHKLFVIFRGCIRMLFDCVLVCFIVCCGVILYIIVS